MTRSSPEPAKRHTADFARDYSAACASAADHVRTRVRRVLGQGRRNETDLHACRQRRRDAIVTALIMPVARCPVGLLDVAVAQVGDSGAARVE